jgi:hypothetical protein
MPSKYTDRHEAVLCTELLPDFIVLSGSELQRLNENEWEKEPRMSSTLHVQQHDDTQTVGRRDNCAIARYKWYAMTTTIDDRHAGTAMGHGRRYHAKSLQRVRTKDTDNFLSR